MPWIDQLNIDRSRLLPGASEQAVQRVEQQLGCALPDDYREFLMVADGGVLGNFILFSAGHGLHPEETLLRANSHPDHDYPLIAIGRDASDDFGFLKADLPGVSCPIYFASHETNEVDRVADSFQSFLAKVASLRPGEGLVAGCRAKRRWDFLWRRR